MHTTQAAQRTASIPNATTLIDRARAMIPALSEQRRQTQAARRLPDETIDAMSAAGFFRVLQPARWGGYEMHPSAFYDIQIALAEGNMSVGWVYGVLGVHPWLMGLMEDKAVRDVWGNDPDTRMCSSLIPVGKAKPVEGGFHLEGHWRFSSGCHHAKWALVGGIVASETPGPPDVRLFLIPRSEYEIKDAWYVGGLSGTGSDDLIVKDTVVPEYRTRRMKENFECTGAGQALNPSPLYRMPFGQIFFRGVSSAGVGALQAMLDVFVTTAKNRAGVLGKAAEDPAAQQTCAEAAATIDEITVVLHRNMQTLWQYAERNEVPPMEVRQRFKMQSALAADRCANLAARLMRFSGAAGIYDEYPFARLLADINAGRQHIANQVEMLGRNLGTAMLGGKPSPDFML